MWSIRNKTKLYIKKPELNRLYIKFDTIMRMRLKHFTSTDAFVLSSAVYNAWGK